MQLKILAVSLCFWAIVPAFAVAADDVVIADFEQPAYVDWTLTGDAFAGGPVARAFADQQSVEGYQGHGFVNSYRDGDRSTGTLTSPLFIIDRPYISFLIGGGNHPGKTCINLSIDGKVVETATGTDDETLAGFSWDVTAYAGQKAAIQIVDQETGRWGHINVDQIIRTDHPQVLPAGNAPLYSEPLRPQFHFSSATNWLNDPNGLVFYAGEYHLFFQRNPAGNQWGNMTWGHAISPDLVHWTQLPDALTPDTLGTMFSGSAVVDWNNSAGFANGTEKPLVAMYTAAGGTSPESKGKLFSQCIAYSNDKGRTWTKYDRNPVIPHVAGENRDPKVIWHEPTKRWIVALYTDHSDFSLYASADLKSWTHLQDLTVDGCSECPDFFPMPVDGNAGNVKWVFTSANGKYVVGSFDGQHFTAEQDLRQVDFGQNFYAMQTFSDIPANDGRRIQIAWMRDGKYPRMPFNGQMSFPAELTLRTTPDGPRIFRNPVREMETLQGNATKLEDQSLKDGQDLTPDITGNTFHLVADLEPGTATRVGLRIFGQTISYSPADHVLSALGETKVELTGGHLKLEVLVDRTTIETFANHGRTTFTSCYLPKPGTKPLTVFAEGATARITAMSIFSLKSAWPAPVDKLEPR